jgi:hypothetical protein
MACSYDVKLQNCTSMLATNYIVYILWFPQLPCNMCWDQKTTLHSRLKPDQLKILKCSSEIFPSRDPHKNYGEKVGKIGLVFFTSVNLTQQGQGGQSN